MSSEYLKRALEKYKINYVNHGDDPCIVDGKDVYVAPQRRRGNFERFLGRVGFRRRIY
jgi:hypothetical protein